MNIEAEELAIILKTAIAEALCEHEDYRKKRRKSRNPEMISTREGINLVGRARFYQLVRETAMKRESSGSALNSTKYVSKKELIKWNNIHP